MVPRTCIELLLLTRLVSVNVVWQQNLKFSFHQQTVEFGLIHILHRSTPLASRRPCVTQFSGLSHSLRKGDEHPAYTVREVWQSLPNSGPISDSCRCSRAEEIALIATVLTVISVMTSYDSSSQHNTSPAHSALLFPVDKWNTGGVRTTDLLVRFESAVLNRRTVCSRR